MIDSIKRLVLGVAVNLCLAQGVVYADTPMAQLQETIQQVMLTMNGAGKRSDPELREKLRDALMPRFDWFEMAKQALGKHWSAIPSRQHEFVAIFAEFLGNSYIGKIGSYKDEKQRRVHLGQLPAAPRARGVENLRRRGRGYQHCGQLPLAVQPHHRQRFLRRSNQAVEGKRIES
ncbi:MAG: ABC transporter substrate-binding protein [Deltaproteobacteria bacterium]|nr:ABC transporter substrate-binding protein [Deltaproteobacteria bacterium]